MNRSMKQMLSALLAVAMVAALLVVPSVAAGDDANGKVYTLTADTIVAGLTSGSLSADGWANVAGSNGRYAISKGTALVVDDFFTVYPKSGGGSDIRPTGTTNYEGFTPAWRISFGGNVGLGENLNAPVNAIQFTTDGEASVKIWWACGGSGSRQMTILKADGTAAATTDVTLASGEATVSTLELDAAGTYYLGSVGGSNHIYGVEVSPAAPAPTEYDVTCDTVAHGTVTTDVAKAAAGATVTVTATPAPGYKLAGITVNGAAISGNTFTMPGQNVTVSATFEAEGTTPVDPVVYTITADTTRVTVTAGSSKSVTYTVTPDCEVYAVSADTSVATATVANGKVTVNGLKAGTTTVTLGVLSGKGNEVVLNVTVRAANNGGTSGGSSSGRPDDRPGTNDPVSTLPFTDVKVEDWFYESVKKANELGLMNGTSETTFAPTDATTRAMVVTILARLAKADTTGGETWYEKGMAWAVEQGISDGTNPESSVTREQLAVMLYRYAKATAVENGTLDFTDAASVSEWATEAMTWAVKNGIILGKGNGTLDPQGVASRAEVCTMLVRFLDVK